MTRMFAWVACSAVCFALVGCGGAATGKVTGTVTMDDQPLRNARVTFAPQGGGRTAMGTTDAEGKYTLYTLTNLGAELGNYKVVITTEQSVAEAAAAASADDAGYEAQAMGDGDYDKGGPPAETIPAKYNTDSTLTAEVKSGDNVHDFPLTST